MRTIRSVLEFDLNNNNNKDDEILYFDGVATKNGLLVGEYAKVEINDIENQEIDGQWYSVISINNSIKIISDFFGFSTIFYTQVGNKFAISIHFDALISYLKKNNFTTTLNYAEIYPYFASNNVVLSQAYSAQTSCTEIKRLPPNKFIEIKNNDIKIKTHVNLNVNKTYDELMRNGLKKTISSLANLKKMSYSTIEQSLSGGKDSRCVLSLALHANLQDSLTIRTSPKYEDGGKVQSKIIDDDFDIALDIVSSLDLKWSKAKKSIAYPISFKDSIDSYRFHRSANYFAFNYTKYNRKLIASDLHIEIAGGVGDAFRSPWGNYLRKLKRGPEILKVNNNIGLAANLVFSLLVKKNEKLLNIFNESQKLFTKEIMDIGGETFFEAIDNHYLCHRNRYHFGNHKQAIEDGVLLYYPLAVKEFIYASKLLSYEDRSKGKMSFDIINILDKSLHSFGYETPFSFDINTSRKIPKNLEKEKLMKILFKETLNEKSKLSMSIYSEPSYNLKQSIDKALNDRIEICRKDEIINLIIDQLEIIPKIKLAKQTEKIRLFNKLDLINIISRPETTNYSLISF